MSIIDLMCKKELQKCMEACASGAGIQRPENCLINKKMEEKRK